MTKSSPQRKSQNSPPADPQIEAYRLMVSFLRSCRAAGKVNNHQWDDFRARLAELKLESAESRAIDLWAMSNLEQHRAEWVRVRVLHPQEAPHFSTAAYGLMLEACQVGMISGQQMEWILEDLGQRIPPPASADDALEALVDIWYRNVEQMVDVRVN